MASPRPMGRTEERGRIEAGFRETGRIKRICGFLADPCDFLGQFAQRFQCGARANSLSHGTVNLPVPNWEVVRPNRELTGRNAKTRRFYASSRQATLSGRTRLAISAPR